MYIWSNIGVCSRNNFCLKNKEYCICQLTVMVIFPSRWLLCACSILNVNAVCCSIAYDRAVLSGAFFNPKPTTLCKKIPGWRLHHFLFSFLQAKFLSLRQHFTKNWFTKYFKFWRSRKCFFLGTLYKWTQMV